MQKSFYRIAQFSLKHLVWGVKKNTISKYFLLFIYAYCVFLLKL